MTRPQAKLLGRGWHYRTSWHANAGGDPLLVYKGYKSQSSVAGSLCWQLKTDVVYTDGFRMRIKQFRYS